MFYGTWCTNISLKVYIYLGWIITPCNEWFSYCSFIMLLLILLIRTIKIIAKIDISFLLILNIDRPSLRQLFNKFSKKNPQHFRIEGIINSNRLIVFF